VAVAHYVCELIEWVILGEFGLWLCIAWAILRNKMAQPDNAHSPSQAALYAINHP
jgi:hypothetical protein